MISLKKYLDSTNPAPDQQDDELEAGVLARIISAMRSALSAMGNCGLDACPALGDGLKRGLEELGARLSPAMSAETVRAVDKDLQQRLRDWGSGAATHYRKKTCEVKELLIVMARTAESVGERDQRCASQLSDVTGRLAEIATLDDLTEIRASIEKSATELKTSVERMTADGKAAIEQLRAEVSVYQARLEEAEEKTSRDRLTGVRSRVFAESEIDRRIATGASFSVAVVDIDEFKKVNDTHGHLIGDELLRQFATELQSACRSTDVVARWGGDEFLIVLDCDLAEAEVRIERLRKWVCGNYKLGASGVSKNLPVNASIGIAERLPGEAIEAVVERADAAMYTEKAASRVPASGTTAALLDRKPSPQPKGAARPIAASR